jgi:cellulose synthase/poly-beta-1,6-N-acetylglucosamine synthase-like glycosyltransferase
MNIEIIIISILVVYTGFIIFFLFGTMRGRSLDLIDHQHLPFVSVVIPARNEEQNIATCLESVLNQTYPKDRHEIILVNDNSTDKTGIIAEEFAGRTDRLKIIIAKENPDLTGRSNALAQGIDIAKGEVILMTDADCVIPPTWVEYIAKRFVDGIDVMGSITLQQTENWFEGMQSLDWALILGVGSATIGLGIPISIIGNNFSIRRSAYDAVNGFRGIKNSVTEDFQLFKSVVDSGSKGARFPLDSRIRIMTLPCPSVKELIMQKHRWGRGGMDLSPLGFAIIATSFITHVALLIGWFFLPLSAMAFVFLIKFLGDLTFLTRVLSLTGKLQDLKYFLHFEMYYLLYVLSMPFKVFFDRKVVWKGRAY